VKAIFIDLDGVTFTFKNILKGKAFFTPDVDLAVLRRLKNTKIVFVTSRSKSEFFKILNITNLCFYVRNTILFDNKVENIHNFVKANNIKKFVILDDDINLQLFFKNEVILIDWYNGLTVHNFFELLNKLKIKIKIFTSEKDFFINLSNIQEQFVYLKMLLKHKCKTPNVFIKKVEFYES
jgi:hypothetical protein